VDAREATREAVRHLIRLGHHRIAFIGGHANLVVTLDRLQGYRQALEEAGLPCDEQLVSYGTFRQESGVAVMQQFLAMDGQRPTGVFAGNDLMAIGAMQAIQQANLAVPRDCSVVGSNDSPIAALVHPRLTSSRAPYYELGREAALTLIAQLGDLPFQPAKKLIPCQLVLRDSTAPPASSRDEGR
jgi:DNA-binding LacI/PurR family transcriptional regulator